MHWHDGLTKIYGVFEGGGAKGIAYEGALIALREKGYWFQGVAGASAGALTATLIAAGLRPSDLRPDMLRILEMLSPGSDAGQLRRLARTLWRVRRHGAALDRERLLEWLDKRLRLAVRGDSAAGDGPVTFEEFFAHSGIELCVVAADLSRRQPVVFSHQTTKHCQVAHAVVASCSIPFVFDGARLVFPWKTLPEVGTDFFSTVVDGGVLTNFPMFVWQDTVFRTFNGLEPSEITIPIVGFLLQEIEPDSWDHQLEEICRTSLPAVTFADTSETSIRPLEALMFGARTTTTSSARARVSAVLSNLVARLAGMSETGSEPRWPPTHDVLLRNMITTVDRTLLTAQGMGGIFTAVLLLLVALIAVGLSATFAGIFVQAIQETRSPLGWLGDVVIGIFCASIIVTILASVPILLGSLPVLNWLLLKPLRNQGYGLARTFFAAPSPPPWTEKRPDVIALSVGFGVSTLTFRLNEQTQVEPLVNKAYDTSIARLEEMQAQGGVLARGDSSGQSNSVSI